MTPLAAKVFRAADADLQHDLARCQFFECSSIVLMAIEMITADLSASGNVYSEMAQLPAPGTVLEFIWGKHRMMAICEQADNLITYELQAAWGPTGEVLFNAGFMLGTDENFGSEWNEGSGFKLPVPAGMTVDEARIDRIRQTNSLLDKMLCMINQPSLIDRQPRDTDKRVVREASRRRLNAPTKWHECRVRPGVHGNGLSTGADAQRRKLHYVRKHFKPSLNRWIDGHWKGNRDLGIHLKWYSVESP